MSKLNFKDEKMELKGRLKLIAEKIPECELVCDVGTDHAYIPIYLVKRGVCKKAVASDVKKGPIESAYKNIKANNLEQYIEARLGDGLNTVWAGEADVIVVAGLGGILMCEILQNGFEQAKKANTIVLQPMNAVEEVRRWLLSNGFEIFDEELVAEGEKLYTVLCARWDGNNKRIDEIGYHIGPCLVAKHDPLLERYINKRLKQLDILLSEIRKSKNMNMEMFNYFSNIRSEMKRQLSKLAEEDTGNDG